MDKQVNPLHHFITSEYLENPDRLKTCFEKILTREFVLMGREEAARIGQSSTRSADIDQDNISAIEFFSAYISNDREYLDKNGFSASKGVFIVGSVGSGKNTILQCYNRFCRRFVAWYNAQKSFDSPPVPARLRQHKILASRKLSSLVSSGKTTDDILEMYGPGNLLVNDIGTAKSKVVRYGNDHYPVSDMIEDLYDFPSNGFGLLYLTSNMPPDELKRELGERAIDRIVEMCNILVLSGPSRRR